MVGESIPQLVAPTKELEKVLQQAEQASLLFSNPDPAIMRQGEAIFLHVRQSPAAVDFACFALSHTKDAFVLKQAFQAIEDNLPSLSLDNPTRYISSLSTLRDFLLAIILSRSAIEKTKSVRIAKSSSSSNGSWSDKRQYSWPRHVELQAYRTFAAVEKRFIGLQVESIYQQNGPVSQAIQSHTQYILSQMASLSNIPDIWPDNEEHFLLAQSNFTVGIELLNVLLDEFGTLHSILDSDGNQFGKSGNVDHSGLLPLQHRWCKAIAQTYIIPSLLDSVIQMLYSTLPGQKQTDNFFLFKPLISLLTRIIGWTFILKDPFAGLEGLVTVERQALLLKQQEENTNGINGDDDAATRKDQIVLRTIPSTHINMVSKNVISVLQLAYQYVATLESHSQPSFCITELQMCFLALTSSRQIVENEANQLVMMESKHFLLQSIKTIIDDIPNSGQNRKALNRQGVYGTSLLFASQLFHAFLTSTENKQLLLAAVDLSNLIESLSTLTGLVFYFAFESRIDSDEEFELIELGDEAVDHIFGCWRNLLPYSFESVQDETLQKIREITFINVIRPYIELRLLNAGSIEENKNNSQSDFGQENVPDVEKYQEQLITLASLVRDANLTACLAFVVECSDSILDQLKHFYQHEKGSTSTEEEKKLESIWEQTHWITLIVGHIIADQSKGEVAVVAQEISCLNSEGQTNILCLVQSLGFTVVELFSKPSNQIQSPRVMETSLWFNARWIPVYLLLDTTPLLSMQFNGQTGQEMLQYLLLCLQNTIRLWASDADVILQVAATMKSFTLSEGTMQILLGLQEFQETVKIITNNLDILPAKTHGPFISAIVGCIYTSSTTQSPEIFFDYIKQAIESRLSRIIHQPNFTLSAISQRSDTIASLLNALDMLNGLAKSLQPKSANAVYDFLSRFFDTLAGLVQLYHQRNEVVISIISVYRTLIGALDLGFGASSHMLNGLNSAVSSLLNLIDERSLLGDNPEMALEEDVPFEGICLVIDLLSDLMLASDNDAADPRLWISPISSLQTSDVCLQGFARITPLLNNNAQSIARVRRKFANLTSKLWISFPHRIIGIAVSASSEDSIDLFQSCTSALVISLSFVESTLLVDCFAAIQQLSIAAEKVLNMIGSISPPVLNIIVESMSKILTTVLNGVLIEPIATSLFDIHLLSIRALLHSLSSEKMGGMSTLENQMANYCAKNSLVSQDSNRVEKVELNSLKLQEVERKRNTLSQVVIQLATLSLQRSAESRNSQQGRREESAFLIEARKVAWQGRAKIRAS